VSPERRDAFVEAVSAANPTVDIFQQRWESDKVVVGVIRTGAMGREARPRSNVENGQVGVADHSRVGVLNFELPFGTSWLALSTWLIALLHAPESGILRVKAAIPYSRGWVSLNGVGTIVFPPESSDFSHGHDRPLGTLVVIGNGLSQDHMLRSLRAFVSCDISPMNA
jgi:G3E family GTPase